jgi:hypothetical protein
MIAVEIKPFPVESSTDFGVQGLRREYSDERPRPHTPSHQLEQRCKEVRRAIFSKHLGVNILHSVHFSERLE